MKLIAIDGNTQKLDGGAMFGNAPKAMWEKWVPSDTHNRIDLACRALLLITDDNKKILFETGIGAFFEPKLRERYGVVESTHVLLENLKKQGFTHEDIDAVVLSHLHFDHAGGLLSAFEEGEPQLLFPNAKIYVGYQHWERAQRPHSRDKASFIPLINDKLKESRRLELVREDSVTNLSPLVTFRFSQGHTVGLMLSQINLKSGPLVFASDLIPGASWVHVPITMGYDRFPEMVIDEKKELLDDLFSQNGMLFFTHDHQTVAGKVEKDEKGKYYCSAVDISELR